MPLFTTKDIVISNLENMNGVKDMMIEEFELNCITFAFEVSNQELTNENIFVNAKLSV